MSDSNHETMFEILVSNLSQETSERELQEYFGRFGEVTAVKLVQRGSASDFNSSAFVRMNRAGAKTSALGGELILNGNRLVARLLGSGPTGLERTPRRSQRSLY